MFRTNFLQVQLYTSGTWYWANYGIFKLESEANQYTIRLLGYSGTAGDSMTNAAERPTVWYHGGMKFSTEDIDNDGSASTHCAQKNKAGWWFNNCYHSCLTCPVGNDFSWYILEPKEPYGRLRAARMLMKI